MTARSRAEAGAVRIALCAVVAALGAASAPAAGSAAPAPACYVRKATWYETMIASREALMRAEAKARAAGAQVLPKGFEPARVALAYRGGARRLKLRVSGMAKLYLGAFATGGLQTHLRDARLIHKEGMPVLLEPGKAPIAEMTGKRHARTVKARRRTSLQLVNTELVLALNGEYDRLEMTIAVERGRGGDKAVFWATAQPALKAQQQAIADRGALWAAVARDFAGPAQQAEQADERNLWADDWTPGDLTPIARRYAAACASSTKGKANKLAGTAKSIAALKEVRRLFQLGRRIELAKADLGEVNPAAMRLAIQDLADTFPRRYAKGGEYLKRLDACEKLLPQLKRELSGGDESALKKAEDLLAFQREALLSNPLLDFDKLLLVRRGLSNLGLVNNWLSNSSVRRNGYDNDIAVLSPVRPDGEVRTLFRPEGGSFVGDVDLHFDADRLLFSMPGKDGWQVYEVRADGTSLRRLTPADQKDVDNYDACYLPDGRIVFTSTANLQGVPCIGGGGHVANLAIADPKTGKMRMLAFEQDHDWCPTVLNDGRVMYLRWEYTDTPHYFTRLIFTMNPDGTNQRSYYGSNSYWPNALFFARPVPGHPTQFVGIVGGHHDVPRMGELILFDTARGDFEADGAVQRIPGRGKKVLPIIMDGLVGGSWPQFLHPWPLGDPTTVRGGGKYFLASRRTQRSRSAPWGIYLVDIFDNMVRIKSQPGYALLEPVPVRKTPRPPAIPDKVDLRRKDAVVYVMDVYEGPGLKGIPRGKVKKLRLFTYGFGYRGMGGHNCFGVESGWDAKRIIGTVPVEADGSAMFRVPANIPISLQPLDENGAALQLMRSWLVAMPGELLGCVGCHEHPNDVVTNYQAMATTRPPSAIEPWHGPVRGMGFLREVQPMLDKHCAGCHDGKKEALPNFADTARGYRGYAKSYHALHRYVRRPGPESDYTLLVPMEYHASTSEVVQVLAKGHHNVRLDAEAWDRLHTWIDLNVPYHATWSESRGARAARMGKRFCELQKLYAGVELDPEAMPPLPTTRPAPVMPKRLAARKAARPAAAGWPFDADQARRRQSDALAAIRPPAASGKDSDPAPALTLRLGTTQPRRDNITCKLLPSVEVEMKLALIPAGEFVMGSDAPAGGSSGDEAPAARVRVEKPFWMATTEVTNAQYRLFDPSHDSRFIDMELKDQERPGYPVNRPDQPVIRVSWQEAVAYCRWLSERTGRRFNLPTEAQWEWACRAGTDGPLWFGQVKADFASFANLSDVNVKKFALERFRPRIAKDPSPFHAWIPKVEGVDDKHQVCAPVGSYKPNPWGLHDVHGNVWEWTRSVYRPYPYRDADGRNDLAAAGRRVARGGSWYDRPKRARSAYRLAYEPYQKVFNVGFRVVAAIEPPAVAAAPCSTGYMGNTLIRAHG